MDEDEFEETIEHLTEEVDNVRADLDALREKVKGVVIELSYAGTSDGYYQSYDDVANDLREILNS